MTDDNSLQVMLAVTNGMIGNIFLILGSVILLLPLNFLQAGILSSVIILTLIGLI